MKNIGLVECELCSEIVDKDDNSVGCFTISPEQLFIDSYGTGIVAVRFTPTSLDVRHSSVTLIHTSLQSHTHDGCFVFTTIPGLLRHIKTYTKNAADVHKHGEIH